jgi:hypothetical protein
VATTELLPAGSAQARIAAVDVFMARHALAFPVVLKPDVGERGQDVCIAHDGATVSAYLQRHAGATLVQAFAPGAEFGVFYVRDPDAARGRLFAITDKRPPRVTGDGKHTLERLILGHDRAVSLAPLFLDRHAQRLFDVPAAGEQIELVEVGTHCLGCKFVDGDWVRTPALEAAIDRISQAYPGFYFGRYDLRTPDIEALRRGEGFTIVELNGVTSEATNIYDPANSLWYAYRVLAEQWRIAFAIGAANRRRGTPVPASLALLRRALAT